MMIKIKELSKIFSSKREQVIALNEIDLEIPKNKFVLIKGPSGCGKSTLLFALGGMLKPSSGSIELQGEDLYKLSKNELSNFRAQTIGFVFQSYNLIPYLNILENILFGIKGNKNGELKKKAIQLVKELNIADRIDHKPTELSIGEKQRVAVARAILSNPDVVLADEPTGNLDPENANEVLIHLGQFKQAGGTVIMVSHSNDADHLADMIIHMEKGKLKQSNQTK